MPTQRVIVAKVSGKAASRLIEKFGEWPSCSTGGEEAVVCKAVDEFVNSLQGNSHKPPVVFYCEWIDLWSDGGLVPSLDTKSAREVTGKRFQVCLHDVPAEAGRRSIDGALTQECKWLRARIREASNAWEPMCGQSVIVVAREVLGGLVMDEEIEASLEHVPEWLNM